MLDFNVSNVFALGAWCEGVLPDAKQQPIPQQVNLDKIDMIFSRSRHKEQRDEVVGLIRKTVDAVMEIIERNEGFSYHNEVMEYLGKGSHTMTYSYYRGLLSLNAHLRLSDVKLMIERFVDKPEKTSFMASTRRKHVLISSVQLPTAHAKPTPQPTELFMPVEGDDNPFEIGREDMRSNDFGGRNVPSMTFQNRIPHFRRMEIGYLDQIHDRFLNGEPIKRSVFGSAVDLEYKGGMTQVFSVLYFWGLIRSIDGILYFNEPIIRKVVELLRSIDYVGVTTVNSTDVLDNLERLVLNKPVYKRDLTATVLGVHEKYKLIEFRDEGLNAFRSFYVGHITAQGRRVFNTWLEIQKVCDPYARQAKQRQKLQT